MDELTMQVPPGAPLPNPGKIVEAKSALTDTVYLVKVKKIIGLRWHSNGELIVNFTYSSKKQKEVKL
jgi:hypothetical protein